MEYHSESSRLTWIDFVQYLKKKPVVNTAALSRHRGLTKAGSKARFYQLHIERIDVVLLNDVSRYRAKDCILAVPEKWAGSWNVECVAEEWLIRLHTIRKDGSLLMRGSPARHANGYLRLLHCRYILSMRVRSLCHSGWNRLNVGPDASQRRSIRVWRRVSSLVASSFVLLHRVSRSYLPE